MEWEMLKVRVADDNNTRLEDMANLHTSPGLSQYQGISFIGSRLQLKLFHVVHIQIWSPDPRHFFQNHLE